MIYKFSNHGITNMMCYIPEDEDDGYFGQEQVPLTDEIKEILEEYPDGQIFKVCEHITRYKNVLEENIKTHDSELRGQEEAGVCDE